MRQLLNCNVCHERQKNRIITKCCHVFCDVCIDRTLTARNRKCPGCGIVFAKVRTGVYLVGCEGGDTNRDSNQRRVMASFNVMALHHLLHSSTCHT